MPHTLATKALPSVDDLLPGDEAQRLQLILQSAYRRALRDMHAIVGEAFDLDPQDFRLPDAVTERFLQDAKFAGAQITETTRTRLKELLIEAQRDGDSTQTLIERIEKLYDVSWKSRPEVIARTEIGKAQLSAAEDRYRATNLVDRVKIRDGDKDSPCKEQNGTTVPIGEHGGLNHPKCTKFILPVLRDGVV